MLDLPWKRERRTSEQEILLEAYEEVKDQIKIQGNLCHTKEEFIGLQMVCKADWLISIGKVVWLGPGLVSLLNFCSLSAPITSEFSVVLLVDRGCLPAFSPDTVCSTADSKKKNK